MKLERFVGGTLESNGYVLYDEETCKAVIIDPGYNSSKFIEFIRLKNLCVEAIILTHKHHDHVGAAQQISKSLDAPVWMHKYDADEYKGGIARYLEGGETFGLGNEECEIIWTPGHSKGSISVKCNQSKWIFTGDTVFDTDLGRTDLAGGSFADMERTVKAIVTGWDNEYRIFPGHDESATMKQVRKYNREFLEIIRKEDLDFGSIEIVALDLDGTTLKDENNISDRTREAVEMLARCGVYVVIATGRTECSLPTDIIALNSLPYIITSNGARIFKRQDEKLIEIYNDFIEAEVIETLVETFQKYSIPAECFVDGRAFIERSELEKIRDFKAPHRARDYVLSTREPVDDIHDFMLKNKTKIENISLNYKDKNEKKAAEAVLKNIDGVTLTSSFPLNHEVGGRTTSKANALKWLMNLLKVDSSKLLACGDSLNDKTMLDMAKIGVAMENGAPTIKAMASYIAEPHYKDGVAKVLEKIYKGKK